MSLKLMSSGIILLAGFSLALTSFSSSSAGIKSQESTTELMPLNSEQTPQQRLSIIINQYQNICASEECQTQLKKLKKFARWGDAKSQLVIASAYLYGDGFEQDTEAAISWLKRAAYNSFPNSQKYSLKAFHMMAKLYQKGIGVEQDLQLATKYFDKLTEKQYGPLLFDRAFVEFEQENLTQGISLLEQASENRFYEASYYLARMYQQGDIVKRDINQAAIYYEKIVKADYKDSRHRLEELISEMESNSATISNTKSPQEKSLINRLNSTLDIEVINVNAYSMDSKDAIRNLLVRLKQTSNRFTAAPGTRIKGRTCGQTSNSCNYMTEEDIEDRLNEGAGN